MPWIVGKLPLPLIKQISSLRFKNPLFEKVLSLATRSFQAQDGVIQQGLGRGMKFNTGPSAAGYLLGTSEPEMQEAIRLFVKSGNVVFDVGANVGFFSLLAAQQVGPSGKIFSFEPLENNAKWVRHNFELNGVQNGTVRVEALGGENTEAEFIISKTMTLGRLSSTGEAPDEVSRVKVPVRKLDTLISEKAIEYPNLIKVDIEGAETEFLKGAHETIKKSKPVLLIELHGTNVGVMTELGKLGYVARAFGEPVEKSVLDCPWNAQILAIPSEQKNSLSII